MRLLFYIIVSLCLLSCSYISREQKFEIQETTILSIHKSIQANKLTFVELTQAYLSRIQRYDQSTELNSIVVINPNALKDAERLDNEFKKTGKFRPLHGIPIVVKDNYQTKDMQTTAGSLALKDFIPAEDAYQVEKLREAGAIVIAKTNMAEWAFSPYVTESSIAGVTRNPYDLSRVPAGSSGGTAAAVAANFAVVGLGTDTGNSIRGPSSHNCLVGIRSSIGLTSRSGIIPLLINHDIGGPMSRTVEDAVRVFDVIAVYDSNDAITEICALNRPKSYLSFLDTKGLQGARIGIFREYIELQTADPAIKAVTEKAILDIKRLGAIVIDPIEIPDFQDMTEHLWCDLFPFQYDLDRYLETLGDGAPFANLAEIVETGKFSDYIKEPLLEAVTNPVATHLKPPCKDVFSSELNVRFRNAVLSVMDRHNLDAIVYPTWSNPPRKVGDVDSPAGDNSQYLSPHTGFPAITVPSGFVYNSLPTGITFVGRACDEGTIIKLAYAYEQGTKHRKPPGDIPKK